MSSALRLSIVYAAFVLPMRFAHRPARLMQAFVLYGIGYYVLLRSGALDVSV